MTTTRIAQRLTHLTYKADALVVSRSIIPRRKHSQKLASHKRTWKRRMISGRVTSSRLVLPVGMNIPKACEAVKKMA